MVRAEALAQLKEEALDAIYAIYAIDAIDDGLLENGLA